MRHSRLTPLLVLGLLLAAGVTILPAPSVSASILPVVTVSGTHFHQGGADLTVPFYGVDDTTGFVNAVYWWAMGNTAVKGHNGNFPVPVNPDDPELDCESIGDYWSAYFASCQSVGVNLVRMGAFDSWGTEILYTAQHDTLYDDAFYEVIDDMLHRANDYGVYVELVLAGSGEWPVYDWDSPGSNPFIVGSTAFNRAMMYENAIIDHIDASPYSSALFAFDTWNEPDGNNIDTGYWAGNLTKFHNWACWVANYTVGMTSHIVDMGVGGGTLSGYGEYGFDCTTGNTGFDVTHTHVYGAAEDEYLVTDRLGWADDAGKPLVIGECGYNVPYPIERWEWYEDTYYENGGQAMVTLSLRGDTTGYPIDITVGATDQSIAEGDSWSYTPTTNLTYNEWSLVTDSGASIDFYTGEITWTPGWADAGTYYLHIHCENPAGSDWANITLNVADDPTLDPPTEWTVSITSNTSAGYANLSVAFTPHITGGTGSYSYQWNFGDGYYSLASNPTHVYTRAGTFHARLIVNSTGLSNTINIVVLEHEVPVPPTPEPDGNATNLTEGLGYFASMLPIMVVIGLVMLMMSIARRD